MFRVWRKKDPRTKPSEPPHGVTSLAVYATMTGGLLGSMTGAEIRNRREK